jgi:heavy metal sensor kinase
MFKSLASRLTALYTLLFAVLALIVFGIINYNLKSNLLERIDEKFYSDGREFTEIYLQGGLDALHQEILLEELSEGSDEMFIRIYSPELDIVDASNTEKWSDLPAKPGLLDNLTAPKFETLTLPARSSRARIFYQPLGDGYLLQTGMVLDDDEQLLASFDRVFLFAFTTMILVGTVIGFYISRRALAGVQQVRETADQISRGDLSQQITFDAQTVEINDLISSINRMQSRIGTLIKELRDVTNNIAHDLRSPVTRMRGLAEITLSGEQTLEEYRNMSGAVIEECDSLVGMINTMLEIAETDARVKPLQTEPVDLVDILSDVAELYSPVAEDKGIKVSLRITDTPLLVDADRSRLQRVIANLLDNALKFTPAGGRVALEARKTDNSVQILISDNGIGIDKDDLPRVWERFYRADSSRSTPGTGLGLSLVQSIVHAHGGTVDIESEKNSGTHVSVRFELS